MAAEAAGGRKPIGRLVLMAPGALALLLGIWGGLARIGWPLPGSDVPLASHGPLLVCGFLGTLIALERAVALGARWAYLAPFSAASGALLVLARAPATLASAAFTLASLLFVGASLVVVARQRAAFTITLATGAAAWAVGNALWLAGWSVREVVLFWAAFLVLTIAGERLELSRLRPPSPGATLRFGVIVALLLAATTATLGAPGLAARAVGAGFVLLAAWLAKHDMALRTVRLSGLPRYVAVCILSGFAWLAVAGLLLAAGGIEAGFGYDAVLHAVFVGFVLAMIFGHAPIILPAVLRVSIPYSPALYVPLAVLHASLVARLLGDLLLDVTLRRWGALGNGAAVALFALTALTVSLRRRGASAPVPARV